MSFRAADWLFSHSDDLDSAVASVLQSPGGAAPTASSPSGGGSREGLVFDTGMRTGGEGEGMYDLVAVISHIGRGTALRCLPLFAFCTVLLPF